MDGVYGDVPRLEFGANYNYFHANAPPGQCGCFLMNGGSATVVYNITPKWAGVADLTLGHASNVDNSGKTSPSLTTCLERDTRAATHSRYVLYGQVMVGGAKEDVNFDVHHQPTSTSLSRRRWSNDADQAPSLGSRSVKSTGSIRESPMLQITARTIFGLSTALPTTSAV